MRGGWGEVGGRIIGGWVGGCEDVKMRIVMGRRWR